MFKRIGKSIRNNILVGLILVKRHGGRPNRERTSFRHRIAAVRCQVQDRLLNLVFICEDRWEFGSQNGFERDVFADQLPEHSLGVCDHLVQIEALPDSATPYLSATIETPTGIITLT